MKLHNLYIPSALVSAVAAQSFVPQPQGLDEVLSEKFPGAKISYKQTNLCETTEGVNSYAGYVTLPKAFLPDAAGWSDTQAANIFFWFFEARNDAANAPTSMFLGGGPGSTTFTDSFGFPCTFNADGNSSTLNEFSWSNNANLLFIDSPAGTGFSFVDLANGTFDHLTQQFTPSEEAQNLNLTHVPATLPSPDPTTLANSTMSAARTLWRFAQVWFNEFPEHKTSNSDIGLWTVSYGGFYGPVTTSYFLDQNDLVNNGRHEVANATTLDMTTLGLLNACIDSRVMAPGFAEFSYKNTFGIQAYSRDIYEEVKTNITRPETGCLALIDTCRALAAEGDPDYAGTNQTVNQVCAMTADYCYNVVQNAYILHSNRDPFDVTINMPATYPPSYHPAFLNQPWVQAELGVPVNFTLSNTNVLLAFFAGTGDPMRVDISFLEHVLSSDVRVAMVYGDRDYRCNWFSAEDVSLALDFPAAETFREAGYAPITANASYEGGLVREHAGLSFSRVFQAGHTTAAYQQETLFRIFDRAMSRRDIASGARDLSGNVTYSSVGPKDVRGVMSERPDPITNVCTVYGAPVTCTEEQLMALADGSAEVENWVVVKPVGLQVEDKNNTGNDDAPSQGKQASTSLLGLAGLLLALHAAGLM